MSWSREVAGEPGHELAAAGVGRDHRDVAIEPLGEVLREQRHRGEVVDGEVEEALGLAGVQVDGHDAVGAGDGDACRRAAGR